MLVCSSATLSVTKGRHGRARSNSLVKFLPYTISPVNSSLRIAAVTMTTAPRCRGEYSECESGQNIESRPSEESSKLDHIRPNAKSWRAPTIMLVSLALGLGIALTHHFVCLGLNNKPVTHFTLSQSWIFRFNTALAFIVKVAFATSVGTAYVQHQWLRLHQNEFRTQEIDALTGILGDLSGFISSSVWYRHPVLTCMALVSW